MSTDQTDADRLTVTQYRESAPRVLICTEREADACREVHRRVITTYEIEDDPAVLTGADGADMTQAAVEWLEQFVEAADPDTHPAYTGNPEPASESVTVTLPRDVAVPGEGWNWRAIAFRLRTTKHYSAALLLDAVADALDAANGSQS